jgi:hypothetical protein
MRTLTKFAFICNLCFWGTIAMQYVKVSNLSSKSNWTHLGFQPFQSSVIVLGYIAVLINLLFFSIFALRKLKGRDDPNPVVLFYINMGSLFFQLFWFMN